MLRSPLFAAFLTALFFNVHRYYVRIVTRMEVTNLFKNTALFQDLRNDIFILQHQHHDLVFKMEGEIQRHQDLLGSLHEAEESILSAKVDLQWMSTAYARELQSLRFSVDDAVRRLDATDLQIERLNVTAATPKQQPFHFGIFRPAFNQEKEVASVSPDW